MTFTTTAGTLSGATTTTNGVATVTLTSTTNVGTAAVTATCGGVSGNVSVTFIAGEVDDVSLSATPNNLSADGVSTSTIRAVVIDAEGNAVDGETVSFSVSAGTGYVSSPTAITVGGSGNSDLCFFDHRGSRNHHGGIYEWNLRDGQCNPGERQRGFSNRDCRK